MMLFWFNSAHVLVLLRNIPAEHPQNVVRILFITTTEPRWNMKRILIGIFTAHSQMSVRICHQNIRRTFSEYGVEFAQNILRLQGEYCPQYSPHIISIWGEPCQAYLQELLKRCVRMSHASAQHTMVATAAHESVTVLAQRGPDV